MSKYITANGVELGSSLAPTRWAAGTTGAETQTGTSGNDAFSGAGGDVLTGGLGDDTYYLWDSRETIVEQVGQGTDTMIVNYWGAATLANNVENLILNSAGATSGTGNSLNNIIIAGSVGATLDGGAGDDILVGGAGADLFKITAGNGSDAIVNFQPSHDVIRLNGYGISNFNQLMALGAQVGSDVKFTFANGETLVVRDINLSSFSAYDFGLAPNTVDTSQGLSQLIGPGKAFTSHGWTVVNNVWNPGSLVSGADYFFGSSYVASDLTSKTTFNWSFPVVTDAYPTIRAYAEISFGSNPYGGSQTGGANALAVQVGNLSSLEVNYDLDFQGNTDGFDVAFDIWLTSQPNGGASTITNEVMIWVHKGGLVPPGTLVGTYSDGIISAKIYTQPGARPYTAVVLDSDTPKGDIDVAAILGKLQSLGIVSSSEYVASLELGAEVASGAGSLAIHNLDLTIASKGSDGAITTTQVTGVGTTTTTAATVAHSGSIPTPVISSFSPDSNVIGDGITNVNHVTLTGTAAAGSTVQVFDGATQVGTATADANGVWSFATGTLADGNHAFSSQAVDAAGNTSAASAVLNVTVDTVAPGAPTVTSFSPDSNVLGDGITNVNHVTLTGAAAAGSTVQVFDGATLIGTATANASGAWSFATGTLADGSHAFTSKAVDAAGNVSAASMALNVTIDTVAPIAPTVTSFSPDSNVVGDGITNVNHVTLTGAAAAGSTVQVFDGATLIGTATANTSGAWSFATGTLADGSHAFTSKAMDTAGNVSATSAALNVTVDTVAPVAPTVTSFSPDSNVVGDGITNVNHVTLTGAAAAGSTVQVFDGVTLIGTATASAGGAWSFATATLVDGNHAFIGKVVDVAGNSSISTALNVNVDTIAPTAPVIVSDILSSSTSVTVNGTAEAGSIVKLFEGSTLLGTGVADASGNWNINSGSLAAGSHDFTATATDSAGNVSKSSNVFDQVISSAVVSGGVLVSVADFNGDKHGDILWQNDNGTVSVWDSGQIAGAHWISNPGTVTSSSHIVGTGDFDGNGQGDLLWRNDDGAVFIWDNGNPTGAHTLAAAGVVATSWHIIDTGDFDGNGHDDILWQNDNGAMSIWDNGQIAKAHIISNPGVVSSSWHIAATGDFDGNGHADILWQNTNGAVSIWDNGQISNAHLISNAGVVSSSWHIVGSGDFDGNGHDDILWQNDNGAVSIWDNGQITGAHVVANPGAAPATSHVVGIGDFDHNGHADILWRDDNGAVSIWDNGQPSGAHALLAAHAIDSSWHIV